MAKQKLTKAEIEQKVALAKELFIYADKTAKEVAEMVGLSEQTLSKYRSGDENTPSWDELKKLMRRTPEMVLAKAYKKLDELIEADNFDGDEFIKLSKSIDYLKAQEKDPVTAILVFKDFTAFLMPQDAELAKTVNQYQQKYINHLIS